MNYSSASPRMKRGMAGRGGPGRGRIKPSSNTGSQPNQNLEGLYSNDRIVNAVTSVLGCNAKVTEKNGKQFEGVFKTISPEASLVLGKANQVEEQKQNGVVDGVLQKTDIIEQFVMHHKDWVRVEFKDVNVEECYYRKDSFKTDFAIGGNKRMNGQTKKELEKWEPSDAADSSETPALEGHHSMENGWSAEKMFEKNEKLYGVKSTYSEGMEEYTTKLDKNDTPEYREREKFAAQKAEEIFKESPYERNTDSGRSEEQLYSSVVRNKTFDRSSTPNWRQPHSDRPPERDQRTARLPQEGFGSPAKKEQVRSQQNDEPPTIQVKEKIDKPATETPVECKPEQKVEAFSDVVKADAKPAQNVIQAKNHVTPANTPVTPANTPVTPQTTQVSTETIQDPSNSPDATTAKTRSKDNVQLQKELKDFSVNFQLPETKKKPKVKKVSEEEQKTSTETTSKEEKNEEAQTPQEVKTDSESADHKAKSELNPNAQEFRPRAKRNTPSPRSNSAPSSSGTLFQNNSPFPYPPNNIYSRNGPRGRGIRQEYMDPTTGYVNATSATGQPFFAHHLPHQFIHQGAPPGMSYLPPGGLRHPGLQHPVFIQQHHHQGPMMVPVGQMPPGHYPDNAIYYGHAMPAMIQSPPQITSPSLQQSQFNFPSPAIPQSVTPVRPVTQPPNVIQQQPSPPVLFVRNSEIQPTQIMTSRPPPPQSFQGN